MALRDELIDLVDDVRDEVIDGEVGLRLDSVVIRKRTWDGAEPGDGTPTDVDMELTPKPKVSRPPPKLIASSGGVYVEGDLWVRRISATYTRAELTGEPSGTSEVFWLINGDPYRVVGEPDERFLEWRVHLRRMQGRP